MIVAPAPRRATSALATLEVRLGALGGSLVAAAFYFAAAGIPPLPPALSVRFGVASPLSGMTRSFVALARGDNAASFRWHPLGPLVFAACVAAAVIGSATAIRGRGFDGLTRVATRRPVWIVATAALAAAWVHQIVWLRLF